MWKKGDAVLALGDKILNVVDSRVKVLTRYLGTYILYVPISSKSRYIIIQF